MRVLLVEDEGLIRMITGEALIDDGFEVIEAWNGDEAAEILDGLDRVDVVLTDVRMPGKLDGIDLALHVRHRCPWMPLVVVSGYATNLAQRLAVLDPPAYFFPKPYDVNRIGAVIRRLTSRA